MTRLLSTPTVLALVLILQVAGICRSACAGPAGPSHQCGPVSGVTLEAAPIVCDPDCSVGPIAVRTQLDDSRTADLDATTFESFASPLLPDGRAHTLAPARFRSHDRPPHIPLRR